MGRLHGLVKTGVESVRKQDLKRIKKISIADHIGSLVLSKPNIL